MGRFKLNLNKIRVVMIETSHPGNIGAAARAMKTMGLTRLYLVNPQDYPCVEATARAAGADDVLANAVTVESLDDAVSDCTLVMGTSARLRSLRWPVVNPREAAVDFSEKTVDGEEVALIFGTERTGLTNDEMSRCHKLINIPTNPDYSSLNVASAVQVLSYELRMQGVLSGAVEAVEQKPVEYAPNENMEGFYGHLQSVLIDIGFLNADNPGHLMPRMRRLYNRARPTLEEVNILRGILTATQKAKK